jgi:hypothetical protein
MLPGWPFLQIGLSYWPAELHRLAESIPGLLNRLQTQAQSLDEPIRWRVHCKDTIPKFQNNYSQKRNCVSIFMCINRSQTHECGNWDWGHAIPEKEFSLQCEPIHLYLRRFLLKLYFIISSLQGYIIQMYHIRAPVLGIDSIIVQYFWAWWQTMRVESTVEADHPSPIPIPSFSLPSYFYIYFSFCFLVTMD